MVSIWNCLLPEHSVRPKCRTLASAVLEKASQRGLKIHPFPGGFRHLSIAVRNVACNKRSPLLELNKSVICGAGGRPRRAAIAAACLSKHPAPTKALTSQRPVWWTWRWLLFRFRGVLRNNSFKIHLLCGLGTSLDCIMISGMCATLVF